MSKVSIEVELVTGAKMGFEREPYTAGRVFGPEVALAELDAGYTMIRQWLVSQLSPADQAKLRGSGMPEPERRG